MSFWGCFIPDGVSMQEGDTGTHVLRERPQQATAALVAGTASSPAHLSCPSVSQGCTVGVGTNLSVSPAGTRWSTGGPELPPATETLMAAQHAVTQTGRRTPTVWGRDTVPAPCGSSAPCRSYLVTTWQERDLDIPIPKHLSGNGQSARGLNPYSGTRMARGRRTPPRRCKPNFATHPHPHAHAHAHTHWCWV